MADGLSKSLSTDVRLTMDVEYRCRYHHPHLILYDVNECNVQWCKYVPYAYEPQNNPSNLVQHQHHQRSFHNTPLPHLQMLNCSYLSRIKSQYNTGRLSEHASMHAEVTTLVKVHPSQMDDALIRRMDVHP